MRKILSLILLNLLMAVPLFAFENADTVLLERGFETSWTTEDAAKWEVPCGWDGLGVQLEAPYGIRTGAYDGTSKANCTLIASDTIKARDKESGVLNIVADWMAISTYGRYFADGNYAYFRVGNVVIASNCQNTSAEIAYSTDGMATYTQFDIGGMTGTANVWGGRISPISAVPFMRISMQLDMTHNKINYIRIYNANTTSYNDLNPENALWEKKDLLITGQDWNNIIIQSGYNKGKGISSSPLEYLKAIKIVETDAVAEKANYKVTYRYQNPNNPKEALIVNSDHNVWYPGFKGETIELRDTLWRTDPYTNQYRKFYIVGEDHGGAVGSNPITLNYGINDVDGRNIFEFYVRPAEIYKYEVVASELNDLVLDSDTSIEGETIPQLTWYKYVKNPADGNWYQTESPYTWTPTEEADQVLPRSYEKADISYFWDTEDVYTNLSHHEAGIIRAMGSNYSGGSTKRHANYDPRWYVQETIPDGGIYQINVSYYSQRAQSSYIEFDTYTDSITDGVYDNGVITDDYLADNDPALATSTVSTGIAQIQGFQIPLNSGIVLRSATSDYNSQAYIDYITLNWMDYLREEVPMKATVKTLDGKKYKTVTVDTPLRSFTADKNYVFREDDPDGISAYCLSDIEAHYVTDSLGNSEKKIFAHFDKINGAVPIGTLCVLSGTPGETLMIPYVNHSDWTYTPEKQQFGSGTSATYWTKELFVGGDVTQVSSNDNYYCLQDPGDGKGVRFCRIDLANFNNVINTSTVMFKIPGEFFTAEGLSKSKPFSCIFSDGGGEITGIKYVTSSEKAANSDATYNMNGQRVYSTTKGLVIRGGKKYFNK